MHCNLYWVLCWLCRLVGFFWLFHNLESLQWHHNGRDGVSNHQPLDCLLNGLFRHRWKTSKLRVTGFCARNSPVTGEFPAQMASNTENVSIWWRHHDDKWKYIQDLVHSPHFKSNTTSVCVSNISCGFLTPERQCFIMISFDCLHYDLFITPFGIKFQSQVQVHHTNHLNEW